MIPCLYDSEETAYDSNGLGKLADAISCTVEEKRNSSYELKMTYRSDGIHADELTEGNIIMAKPSDSAQNQPLRIYKVTSNPSGEFEICASYMRRDSCWHDERCDYHKPTKRKTGSYGYYDLDRDLIAQQREHIRSYADELGWEIDEEYIDIEGMAEYERLNKDCENRK